MGERILDFGCGQGDYVRLLQGQGVRIWGMEFFYRAAQQINTGAVHQMAESLFHTLRTHGRFDTVICEYVLNSTDRLAAEQAVMTCLNAFCKPGGRIYASGRQYQDNTDYVDHTRPQANTKYHVSFLDPNGYTGVAWAITGKHDRPWGERPIFGTVRFMSLASTGRKFDSAGYITRVRSLEQGRP